MVDTLVVVAHPDDELLLAGGALVQFQRIGRPIGVVTLAANAQARSLGVQNIAKQQEGVFKALSVDYYKNFDFPDSELAQVPHLHMVQAIESCIKETWPIRVITHFPGDNHMDHKCVSQACQEAVRIFQRQPDGVRSPIREILYGEVPSSTDWGLGEQFHPNVWIPMPRDILDTKIQLLEQYQEVLRAAPHPRSRENIEALAKQRGAQCGHLYAEAFQQVFRIV